MPADGLQVENILLGADQRSGAQIAGAGFNGECVGLRVAMMVAEEFVADNLETPAAEIGQEGRRIADAAKGEEILLPQGCQIGGRIARGKMHGVQMRIGIEDWRVRILANGSFDCGRALGAGDDQNAGASQSRAGLTQAASGQEVASTERIGGVDEDDVNVAGEAAVLETVIEDEIFHAASGQFGTAGETVRTDAKGDSIAETRSQKLDFVAGVIGVRIAEGISCVRRGGLAAIAASQDADALPFGEQTLGNPENHRRFAGAAHGEVPDADDEGMELSLREKAGAVGPGVKASDRFIWHGERPEKRIAEIHAGRSVLASRAAMCSRARAVAPRWRSQSSRAAWPMRRQSGLSSINCTQTFPSCGPLVT